MKEAIEQVAFSAKAAWTVVGSTITTSVAALFNIIPDDIGKLGTLIGIVLSIILIRVHIINTRKVKLEIDIMERKERERLNNLG